ncbi:hypothetical protein [Osedax japonicus RNA virus 1]|uniref:hypothetical protein n=1 Tax=Osedax japonicus RNA virus 1 TaxID=2079458 RepID=UPI000E32E284|nr:hypothetical protein [Osedax japonicus RNA virus 1]BBC62177.1 hypothetical protein [Osedax japonicus RNA virus 1]
MTTKQQTATAFGLSSAAHWRRFRQPIEKRLQGTVPVRVVQKAVNVDAPEGIMTAPVAEKSVSWAGELCSYSVIDGKHCDVGKEEAPVDDKEQDAEGMEVAAKSTTAKCSAARVTNKHRRDEETVRRIDDEPIDRSPRKGRSRVKRNTSRRQGSTIVGGALADKTAPGKRNGVGQTAAEDVSGSDTFMSAEGNDSATQTGESTESSGTGTSNVEGGDDAEPNTEDHSNQQETPPEDDTHRDEENVENNVSTEGPSNYMMAEDESALPELTVPTDGPEFVVKKHENANKRVTPTTLYIRYNDDNKRTAIEDLFSTKYGKEKLQFSTDNNAHATCAAARKMANVYITKEIKAMVGKVRPILVGGNPVPYMSAGVATHCTMPLATAKDVARHKHIHEYVCERAKDGEPEAEEFVKSIGVLQTKLNAEKHKLYETEHMCYNGAQACSYKSNVAVLIETVYDMPRDTTMRRLAAQGVEIVYYTMFVPLFAAEGATIGYHRLLDAEWSLGDARERVGDHSAPNIENDFSDRLAKVKLGDEVTDRGTIRYHISSVPYVHEINVMFPWMTDANYEFVGESGKKIYVSVEVVQDVDKFVTFKATMNSYKAAADRPEFLTYECDDDTIIAPMASLTNGKVGVVKAIALPQAMISFVRSKTTHCITKGVFNTGTIVADAISMCNSIVIKNSSISTTDDKLIRDINSVALALVRIIKENYRSSEELLATGTNRMSAYTRTVVCSTIFMAGLVTTHKIAKMATLIGSKMAPALSGEINAVMKYMTMVADATYIMMGGAKLMESVDLNLDRLFDRSMQPILVNKRNRISFSSANRAITKGALPATTIRPLGIISGAGVNISGSGYGYAWFVEAIKSVISRFSFGQGIGRHVHKILIRLIQAMPAPMLGAAIKALVGVFSEDVLAHALESRKKYVSEREIEVKGSKKELSLWLPEGTKKRSTLAEVVAMGCSTQLVDNQVLDTLTRNDTHPLSAGEMITLVNYMQDDNQSSAQCEEVLTKIKMLLHGTKIGLAILTKDAPGAVLVADPSTDAGSLCYIIPLWLEQDGSIYYLMEGEEPADLITGSATLALSAYDFELVCSPLTKVDIWWKRLKATISKGLAVMALSSLALFCVLLAREHYLALAMLNIPAAVAASATSKIVEVMTNMLNSTAGMRHAASSQVAQWFAMLSMYSVRVVGRVSGRGVVSMGWYEIFITGPLSFITTNIKTIYKWIVYNIAPVAAAATLASVGLAYSLFPENDDSTQSKDDTWEKKTSNGLDLGDNDFGNAHAKADVNAEDEAIEVEVDLEKPSLESQKLLADILAQTAMRSAITLDSAEYGGEDFYSEGTPVVVNSPYVLTDSKDSPLVVSTCETNYFYTNDDTCVGKATLRLKHAQGNCFFDCFKGLDNDASAMKMRQTILEKTKACDLFSGSVALKNVEDGVSLSEAAAFAYLTNITIIVHGVPVLSGSGKDETIIAPKGAEEAVLVRPIVLNHATEAHKERGIVLNTHHIRIHNNHFAAYLHKYDGVWRSLVTVGYDSAKYRLHLSSDLSVNPRAMGADIAYFAAIRTWAYKMIALVGEEAKHIKCQGGTLTAPFIEFVKTHPWLSSTVALPLLWKAIQYQMPGVTDVLRVIYSGMHVALQMGYHGVRSMITRAETFDCVDIALSKAFGELKYSRADMQEYLRVKDESDGEPYVGSWENSSRSGHSAAMLQCVASRYGVVLVITQWKKPTSYFMPEGIYVQEKDNLELRNKLRGAVVELKRSGNHVTFSSIRYKTELADRDAELGGVGAWDLRLPTSAVEGYVKSLAAALKKTALISMAQFSVQQLVCVFDPAVRVHITSRTLQRVLKSCAGFLDNESTNDRTKLMRLAPLTVLNVAAAAGIHTSYITALPALMIINAALPALLDLLEYEKATSEQDHNVDNTVTTAAMKALSESVRNIVANAFKISASMLNQYPRIPAAIMLSAKVGAAAKLLQVQGVLSIGGLWTAAACIAKCATVVAQIKALDSCEEIVIATIAPTDAKTSSETESALNEVDGHSTKPGGISSGEKAPQNGDGDAHEVNTATMMPSYSTKTSGSTITGGGLEDVESSEKNEEWPDEQPERTIVTPDVPSYEDVKSASYRIQVLDRNTRSSEVGTSSSVGHKIFGLFTRSHTDPGRTSRDGFKTISELTEYMRHHMPNCYLELPKYYNAESDPRYWYVDNEGKVFSLARVQDGKVLARLVGMVVEERMLIDGAVSHALLVTPIELDNDEAKPYEKEEEQSLFTPNVSLDYHDLVVDEHGYICDGTALMHMRQQNVEVTTGVQAAARAVSTMENRRRRYNEVGRADATEAKKLNQQQPIDSVSLTFNDHKNVFAEFEAASTQEHSYATFKLKLRKGGITEMVKKAVITIGEKAANIGGGLKNSSIPALRRKSEANDPKENIHATIDDMAQDGRLADPSAPRTVAELAHVRLVAPKKADAAHKGPEVRGGSLTHKREAVVNLPLLRDHANVMQAMKLDIHAVSEAGYRIIHNHKNLITVNLGHPGYLMYGNMYLLPHNTLVKGPLAKLAHNMKTMCCDEFNLATLSLPVTRAYLVIPIVNQLPLHRFLSLVETLTLSMQKVQASLRSMIWQHANNQGNRSNTEKDEELLIPVATDHVKPDSYYFSTKAMAISAGAHAQGKVYMHKSLDFPHEAVILMSMANMERAVTDFSTPLFSLQGIPGSGKTYCIVSNADHRDAVVGCRKESLLGQQFDCSYVKTLASVIINPPAQPLRPDILYIDEYLAVHGGEILIVIALLKPRLATVLIGDVQQMSYYSSTGIPVYYNDLDIPKHNSYALPISATLPAEIIAAFPNKYPGMDIHTTNDTKLTLEVQPYSVSSARAQSLHVAYGLSTALMLKKTFGERAMTISASQGMRSESVVINIPHNSINMFNAVESAATWVAVSRTTKEIIVNTGIIADHVGTTLKNAQESDVSRILVPQSAWREQHEKIDRMINNIRNDAYVRNLQQQEYDTSRFHCWMVVALQISKDTLPLAFTQDQLTVLNDAWHDEKVDNPMACLSRLAMMAYGIDLEMAAGALNDGEGTFYYRSRVSETDYHWGCSPTFESTKWHFGLARSVLKVFERMNVRDDGANECARARTVGIDRINLRTTIFPEENETVLTRLSPGMLSKCINNLIQVRKYDDSYKNSLVLLSSKSWSVRATAKPVLERRHLYADMVGSSIVTSFYFSHRPDWSSMLENSPGDATRWAGTLKPFADQLRRCHVAKKHRDIYRKLYHFMENAYPGRRYIELCAAPGSLYKACKERGVLANIEFVQHAFAGASPMYTDVNMQHISTCRAKLFESGCKCLELLGAKVALIDIAMPRTGRVDDQYAFNAYAFEAVCRKLDSTNHAAAVKTFACRSLSIFMSTLTRTDVSLARSAGSSDCGVEVFVLFAAPSRSSVTTIGIQLSAIVAMMMTHAPIANADASEKRSYDPDSLFGSYCVPPEQASLLPAPTSPISHLIPHGQDPGLGRPRYVKCVVKIYAEETRRTGLQFYNADGTRRTPFGVTRNSVAAKLRLWRMKIVLSINGNSAMPRTSAFDVRDASVSIIECLVEEGEANTYISNHDDPARRRHIRVPARSSMVGMMHDDRIVCSVVTCDCTSHIPMPPSAYKLVPSALALAIHVQNFSDSHNDFFNNIIPYIDGSKTFVVRSKLNVSLKSWITPGSCESGYDGGLHSIQYYLTTNTGTMAFCSLKRPPSSTERRCSCGTSRNRFRYGSGGYIFSHSKSMKPAAVATNEYEHASDMGLLADDDETTLATALKEASYEDILRFASWRISKLRESRRHVRQYPKIRVGEVMSSEPPSLPSSSVFNINFWMSIHYPANVWRYAGPRDDDALESVHNVHIGFTKLRIKAEALCIPQTSKLYHVPRVRSGAKCSLAVNLRTLNEAYTKRNGSAYTFRHMESNSVIAANLITNLLRHMCKPNVNELLAQYRRDPIGPSTHNVREWVRFTEPEKLRRLGKKMEGIDDFGEVDLSKMNFEIKSAVKIKPGTAHITTNPQPQTITAAHAAMTAIFSGLMEQVWDRLVAILNDNIFIPYAHDASAFNAFLTHHLRNYTTSEYYFHEIDISAYDKSQDYATATAIMALFELLGVTPEVMDAMDISLRTIRCRNATVGISFSINSMMRSGAFYTLIGNTMVSLMVTACAYGESFRKVICASFIGDDSLIASTSKMPMKVPVILENRCGMEAKTLLTSVSERVSPIPPMFCSGYIIYDPALHTYQRLCDPIRRMFKLGIPVHPKALSKQDRYRSLKEEVDSWAFCGLWDSLASSSDRRLGVSGTKFVMEQLRSLTHNINNYSYLYGPEEWSV